jgi:CDP-2,3-bis-(O-geranylgeranyl)-sn-glycerol synthase
MFCDLLLALWFLLPAACANMAPVLSNKLPLVGRWQAPIDFGREFRGHRVFGSHKTWRGLASGMLLATLIFWLQQMAVNHTVWGQYMAHGVSYAHLPTLLLGPAFGLGALGGDAIESFFKRQRGIASGNAWVPFDQIDYIVGSILLSLPFVVLPAVTYAYIFVIWFGIHLAASYTGYELGLKERPI